MNEKFVSDDEQNKFAPHLNDILEEALALKSSLPKRKYTQQEIDEARGNLALMNDRVFLMTFIDNKNNHIVKGIVDAARKIHGLAPIPPIEKTRVQDLSLFDVLGRGMVGDLTGWGSQISLAIEAQKSRQDDYAVRGILTAGNTMRVNFNAGESYAEAPDAITINILDFRLPELKHRKMFCSRIVRAEYDSRETFLADKYSEFYIELPKMADWIKAELPEEYHDLWDICCIFRAKINKHEEVIRMQAVASPTALELSSEVKKAAAPSELVNSTLFRTNELLQFCEYVYREKQKAAQEAAQKAAQEAAQSTEQKWKNEMIIMALKSNAPPNVIEAMQKGAGISDSQLEELRKQAQEM